jgi:hypothetical protein
MTAGHDADFALAGGDDAGAVGTDEAHRFVLEVVFHPHHVHDRNALGDADDQGNPASAASMMASAAKGGGTKIMLALAPAILTASDRIENGNVVHLLAALAGGHAGDHLGAVINTCAGMELAFFSSNTLHQQFGLFIDKYAHDSSSLWIPKRVTGWRPAILRRRP